MKFELSVKKLLDVAETIANLPTEKNGDSKQLADLLKVNQVLYTKTGDRTHLTIVDKVGEFEEFSGKFLRQQKTWKAAMAYAFAQEYHEYVDNLGPGAWIRMEKVSALMGFESGYTDDSSIEEMLDLESSRGVFFGSKNQIKVVTQLTETIYEIDEFLEIELND